MGFTEVFAFSGPLSSPRVKYLAADPFFLCLKSGPRSGAVESFWGTYFARMAPMGPGSCKIDLVWVSGRCGLWLPLPLWRCCCCCYVVGSIVGCRLSDFVDPGRESDSGMIPGLQSTASTGFWAQGPKRGASQADRSWVCRLLGRILGLEGSGRRS